MNKTTKNYSIYIDDECYTNLTKTEATKMLERLVRNFTKDGYEVKTTLTYDEIENEYLYFIEGFKVELTK